MLRLSYILEEKKNVFMLLFVFYKHVSFSMTGDSVLSFCFSAHKSFAIHSLLCIRERWKKKKLAINLGSSSAVVGIELRESQK